MFRHKLQSLLCGAALFGAALAGAAETSWDFSKPVTRWKEPFGITLKNQDKALLLEVTGKDSRIVARNLAIPCAEYGFLKITYRAEGFVGGTSGELFYGTDKFPGIDGNRYVQIGSLTCDGKTHEMVVNTSGWRDQGMVNIIRLDLVNQAPGRIWLEKMEFLPPGSKQAEIVDASLPADWPHRVKPEFRPKPPKRKIAINEPYFTASMCCYPGRGTVAESGYLRHHFNLDFVPEKALLQIAADDYVEEIYLNGKQIRGRWTKSWRDLNVMNVKRYLKQGENVLAVRYANVGDLGGVVYELSASDSKGDYLAVNSGKDAKMTFNAPSGWFKPDFADGAWKAPETRGCPPAPPWTGHKLAYRDCRPECGTVTFGDFAVQGVEHPSQMTVQVKIDAQPALKDDEMLIVKAETPWGRTMSLRRASVRDFAPVRNADGSCTFTFKDFDCTEYGAPVKVIVSVNVEQRKATNAGKTEFSLPSRPIPGAENAPAVTLDYTSGTPLMKLDGQPYYPIMLTTYNYFDPSVDQTSPNGFEGKNSPVNVCAVRFGGRRDQWWVGDDQYDFEAADRVFRYALETYPDAKIMVWLWCQPGPWYGKKHPERMARNNKNQIFDYYLSAVTFSGEEYRRDAVKAVKAFVEYAEKHYGSRIVAYSPIGGVSCEWQAWDAHNSHNKGTMFDYGETAKKDFKAFVQQKLGSDVQAEIPTIAERLDPQDAIFRDPVKNQMAILYDEYYSDAIAGCIDVIAHAIREQLGGRRKLIGTYYGYVMEYGIYNWCVNLAGHNAGYRLMKSDALDVFFSPPSYTIRDIGGPSADMKLFGSIAHHGKYSMLEDDTRTSLTAFQDVQGHHPVTDQHTFNVLRRNWGMALARRVPINMLPLVQGNDYDSPVIRADMREVGKAGKWLMAKDRKSGVETAFVMDADCLKYLAMTTKRDVEPDPVFFYGQNGQLIRNRRNSQRLTGPLYAYQQIQLSQFGAGCDYLQLDDVPELADQYKLWVFGAAFLNDPRMEKALAELSKRNVTIVILYGAGFIKGDSNCDTAAMSRLLGMQIERTSAGPTRMKCLDGKTEMGVLSATDPRFTVNDPKAKVLARYKDNQAPALAVGKLGSATLVFCGSPAVTEEFLASMLKQAGGHLYAAPGDVLFAGYGVVAVHTKTAGVKTLTFPQPVDVYDLYAKQVVARNVTSYQVRMPALETRVFLTGTPEEIAQLAK